MAEARRRLAAVATTGDWEHDEQAAQAVPTLDATVFKYHGGRAPDALIWLTWERERAEVSNIVPCEAGSLTYDEYNGIAEWFTQDVLSTALAGVRVRIELGRAEEGIDDLLSVEATTALRSFSGAANKTTGAGHPMDAERWRRFVILVHIEDANLDADMLRRWLHEDEGWDEDQAFRLAIQYEQARDLLRQYDIKREDP